MILFLDTETTGFVQKDLPPEHPTQPHLVQLGLVLADEREWATVELIVSPQGYLVPEGAAKVHGITTDIATDCGVPLLTALSVFSNLLRHATLLVAHNLWFDDLVMRAAIAQSGRAMSTPWPKQTACTMQMAGEIMKLPPTDKMRAVGFDKWKPPSLSEAYRHFFKEELVGAHGALVDCRACARIYFAMTGGAA